jgi:hypothetical protein
MLIEPAGSKRYNSRPARLYDQAKERRRADDRAKIAPVGEAPSFREFALGCGTLPVQPEV